VRGSAPSPPRAAASGHASLVERLAPGLAGQRLPIGTWPTPVRAVDVGGGAPLLVKDEGHCAPDYGGNKVRKLEWLLPRVRPGSHLVTAGAVGSNFVLATAFHGRRRGIAVHAVLVPQPDTAAARRNAGVSAALLHRAWPATSDVDAVRQFGRAVVAARHEAGRAPNVVWIGGTTPAGVLGWVEGGLELAAQVATGEVPAPARVVVPAGSGGIAAGLLVGLRAGGLDTIVHAVRVADRTWANRAAVLGTARWVTRRLRAAGADLPDVDPAALHVDHRWFGAAYGQPTPAGDQAESVARAAGLPIDPTYSAKALAAAIALARVPEAGQVLFVDTANAQPVERLVPGDLAPGGLVPPPPPELAVLLTTG
jgi:D-cysteine desulfhydrase